MSEAGLAILWNNPEQPLIMNGMMPIEIDPVDLPSDINPIIFFVDTIDFAEFNIRPKIVRLLMPFEETS